MLLPIKIYPDPILKTKSKKIDKIDDEIKNFCNSLKNTLELDKIRLGLSANQVGKDWRIIAVKEKGGTYIIINPEIVEKSNDMIKLEEGCLSFPDIFGKVNRHKTIKIKGLTPEGKKLKLTKSDLTSVIFQHEIDHINGIVFIDRADKNTLHKYKYEKKLDVVFLGNSEFSLTALQSLAKNPKINISYVVCGCDKKCGRGQKQSCSPVKIAADKLGIPIIETNDINSPDAEKMLEIIDPDYYVTASYGQILKPWLLYDNNKKSRAINIHPSLLPNYRGATPIQSALLNGDEKTGITIMLMTEGLDEGPILDQETIDILDSDNATFLFEKTAKLSGQKITNVLLKYHEGKTEPKKQKNSEATFSKKITAADAKIDFKNDAKTIVNKIRAFSIWPKTYCMFGEKRIKILDARFSNEKIELGVVKKTDDKILVGTKSGSIEILKVQIEGKAPVGIKAFISGYSNFVGSKLL